MWLQKQIQLGARERGFHLITDEVLQKFPEIGSVKVGLAHFLLQHTSASLSLNENADSSVRRDMESHFNQLAPENAAYYEHTFEGADDMPAHIKSGLLGTELTLPISDGKLMLGTWQGIYVVEHRARPHSREIVLHFSGTLG